SASRTGEPAAIGSAVFLRLTPSALDQASVVPSAVQHAHDLNTAVDSAKVDHIVAMSMAANLAVPPAFDLGSQERLRRQQIEEEFHVLEPKRSGWQIMIERMSNGL